MSRRKLCRKHFVFLLFLRELIKYMNLLMDMPFYEFRYMDYVFGNETEARTFSKVHGWEVMVLLLIEHYQIDGLRSYC